MKCYNHNDAEAVAVCVNCGRALCKSCSISSIGNRLVCSPTCDEARKQTEEFILLMRNRGAHAARVNAYFTYGIGVVFILGAVAFQMDTHSWPLTIFVGAGGIGMLLAGAGFMRVAKHKGQQGSA